MNRCTNCPASGTICLVDVMNGDQNKVDMRCPEANATTVYTGCTLTIRGVGRSTRIILQTAICEVGNPNTLASTEAQLLLDSGDQQSYITIDLAAQLGPTAVGQEKKLVQTFGLVGPLKQRLDIVDIHLTTRTGEKMALRALATAANLQSNPVRC